MTKRLRRALLVCAFAMLSSSCSMAQPQPSTKTHTLRGKIEGINEFAHSLRVNQEKIEGYSDARVMTYNVADATMVDKLVVGDQIVATIHENEDTLYDIRVVRIDDRL